MCAKKKKKAQDWLNIIILKMCFEIMYLIYV